MPVKVKGKLKFEAEFAFEFKLSPLEIAALLIDLVLAWVMNQLDFPLWAEALVTIFSFWLGG